MNLVVPMVGSPLRRKRAENGLTVSDMVLIATAEAASWTTNPVPYGEIVVRAWRLFPAQFSLPNHPEFPDSSDVHKRLYGPLKSGDWIESLGSKTFRITDLGLAKARSELAHASATLSLRPMLEIELHEDATTWWMITTILDAAGPDISVAAKGLLATILNLRFSGESVNRGTVAVNLGETIVVGDTEFHVLIPASLESLQDWLSSVSGEGRRLLVRDSVLSSAQSVLEDSEYSAVWVFGLESFLAQMVDGMAVYDRQRTVELLKAVADQFNRIESASIPRLRLNFLGRK